MYEPNVVGDWQEYEDEHAGLRIRVHGLEKAEPSRGRDDAAEGLDYFRFRVTVENRTAVHHGIHLEDGQLDVRVGGDGESAFLDWRNSRFIEGFDVYPLRRVTSVLYAAAAEDCLSLVDVQVQLKVDDEWTERYLWTGGIGPHGSSVGVGARSDAAPDSFEAQVISFLERESGPGPAS